MCFVVDVYVLLYGLFLCQLVCWFWVLIVSWLVGFTFDFACCYVVGLMLVFICVGLSVLFDLCDWFGFGLVYGLIGLLSVVCLFLLVVVCFAG